DFPGTKTFANTDCFASSLRPAICVCGPWHIRHDFWKIGCISCTKTTLPETAATEFGFCAVPRFTSRVPAKITRVTKALADEILFPIHGGEQKRTYQILGVAAGIPLLPVSRLLSTSPLNVAQTTLVTVLTEA